MSDQTNMREHHFELVNDAFRIVLDATCPTGTWQMIVGDIMRRLVEPTAVVRLPEALSAEQANEIRERWHSRWTA